MHKLKKNSKMRAASLPTYNFSLPMGGTCPQAGECRRYCYYHKFYRMYPNVGTSHREMLKLTRSDDFEAIMVDLLWRSDAAAYRWHDCGDIYSAEYLAKIISIAELTPHIRHYFYTKSVSLVKSAELPSNITAIYSLGGREDSLIDVRRDRHSKIFKNIGELEAAGYVDASRDDTVAWQASSNKIGLIAH